MNTNTYNAIAFKSSLELLKSVRMLMPLMLTILNLDDVCHAFIFYLYYNYYNYGHGTKRIAYWYIRIVLVFVLVYHIKAELKDCSWTHYD